MKPAPKHLEPLLNSPSPRRDAPADTWSTRPSRPALHTGGLEGVQPLAGLVGIAGDRRQLQWRSPPLGERFEALAAGGPPSTLPTASTSNATNDAGLAGARRRRTVAGVLTIRCCNASKSSRSPVHTTSSPSSTQSTLSWASRAALLQTTPTRKPSHTSTRSGIPPGMPCGSGSCWTARASSSPTGPVSSGDKLPMATVSRRIAVVVPLRRVTTREQPALTWLKFADLGRARFPDLRLPRADGANAPARTPSLRHISRRNRSTATPSFPSFCWPETARSSNRRAAHRAPACGQHR